MSSNTTTSPGRTLTIARTINAPRELVWLVWTDPEHIKNWWGPNGFTNTIFQMDVKPGGVWEFIMNGPDGKDYKNKSIYKEVVKPQRIVFEHVSAPKFQNTITFTEEGKKTLLTIEMLFETAEERDNVIKVFKADEGLKQNIDKLEKYLTTMPNDREIILTRVLNAPRELVYKAWTDPKHLLQWWGPKGFTNTFHEIDVRPGGTWRFIMHGPDGVDYPNKIVYEEVVKPERLVYAHGSDIENDPDQFHVTITFEEQEGKTKLTMRSLFKSAEAVEAVKKFGAVEGGKQTIDKLEAHLTKMN